MECIILGCGGSLGVPQIGCKCYVCSSENSKNKRTRSSIVVKNNGKNILIDAGPDLRIQSLKHEISDIDAVLMTHAHADHISGMDDLKPFAFQKSEKMLDIYANKETFDAIKGTYSYLFQTKSRVYKPILRQKVIENNSSIDIFGQKIDVFEQNHGEMASLGFRFGDLAYSTDFKFISDYGIDVLKGVDTWIVDCLRFYYAPTHMVFEHVLELIEKVGAKRAILTHMAHDIEYDSAKEMLPKNVEMAYDGMKLIV